MNARTLGPIMLIALGTIVMVAPGAGQVGAINAPCDPAPAALGVVIPCDTTTTLAPTTTLEATTTLAPATTVEATTTLAPTTTDLGSAGQGLPATGNASGSPVLLGAALVLLGGTLLVVGRRPQQRQAS
jgi:LPXTG-motif cell wall-anchored protein